MAASFSTTSSNSNDKNRNTDAFLTSIETKLRMPFSSLDLAKTIDANADPVSYLKTLREAVFDPESSGNKMDKVMKLRILIALMGLERARRVNDDFARTGKVHNPNGNGNDDDDDDDDEKTDENKKEEENDGIGFSEAERDVIWNILKNGQDDDEEWVRVISSIVRGKMYVPQGDSSASSVDDGNETGELQELLKKNNTSILKETREAIESSHKMALGSNMENGELGEVEETKCMDVIPFYAPLYYHLLDPPLLRKVLPELYQNVHFDVNTESEIFKVDQIMEQKRVDEEEKEMEAQRQAEIKKKAQLAQKKQQMAAQNKLTPKPAAAPRPKVSAAAANTMRATGLGRGRLAPATRGRGRGGSMRVASRGGSNAGPIMPGRITSAGGRAKTSMRQNTMFNTGKKTQANLGMRGMRGTVKPKGRGGLSANARSRMKMIDSTDEEAMEQKLRVNKLLSVEDNKAKRKKLLMEMAAKSGLKRRKGNDGEGSSFNQERPSIKYDRGEQHASNAFQEEQNDDSDQSEPEDLRTDDTNTTNNMGMSFLLNAAAANSSSSTSAPAKDQELSHAQEPPIQPYVPPGQTSDMYDDAEYFPPTEHHPTQTQQPQPESSSTSDPLTKSGYGVDVNIQSAVAAAIENYTAISSCPSSQPNEEHQSDDPLAAFSLDHQPTNAPPPSHESWQQLLEQSNKLSTQDRIRVEQFFTSQYNPTPEVSVYRVKLHEEKRLEEQTGNMVKETLFLELDYNTFGFKKFRKIKKK